MGMVAGACDSLRSSHWEIIASYAPVWVNASAASFLRSSSVVAPSLVRSSLSRASYWAGSVTMATDAWFLAAERTIDGPPISICSMASGSVTPGLLIVASNG